MVEPGTLFADAVCGDQGSEQYSVLVGLMVALLLAAVVGVTVFGLWKKKWFRQNAGKIYKQRYFILYYVFIIFLHLISKLL